jgi:hypothetical protein
VSDHQCASHPPAFTADQPRVRPHAMTSGRTRPRYQLAIEALVTTTADPRAYQALNPEHQRICDLCREVKAVAEVSALLSIPIGAARILVADLAEAGMVVIHQPGSGEAGGQSDAALLERVLSGLRKHPDADVRAGQSPGHARTAGKPAERWLADGYQVLSDDLGTVLDIETGLREALLHSHHDAAVAGLDDVLDVQAGLHEALRTQPGVDT